MSKQFGFMVINRRTGFLLEGKQSSARIFDNQAAARRACRLNRPEEPLPLTYEQLTQSLLKGASFSFDSEEGHRKFLVALRNDPANKALSAYSQDREFIKWRHEAKTPNDTSVDNGSGVKVVPAKQPSVEAPTFDPAILVR